MQPKSPFWLRNIKLMLIIILFFKIAGYFSITEVRSITQVFKIISRVGMTATTLFILLNLRKIGCVNLLRLNNTLNMWFYVLYLIIGVASFTWSTKPSYSFLQWIMTFESFIFVFLFYQVIYTINHYFPSKKIDLVEVFTKAIFPIILIFVIGAFVFPDVFYREMRGGEEIRLGGWIMNPNELGMLASILGAMAYIQTIAQKGKKKILPILALTAALIILVLTASRSSLIGFLMILGLLIFKSENKKLKIGLTSVVLLAAPVAIKHIVFKEGGSMEEVMSMTGRLPFWTALLNEGIVKEPFFGYGFMRINYTDYFQGLNTYPGRMTHNTFMQVLMNLGFVGLFVALTNFILTIKNYIRNRKNYYGDFFIALIIPVVINSFTEFGIFGDANYGILFWHFLIFLFLFKEKEFLTTREKIKQNIFETRYKPFLS